MLVRGLLAGLTAVLSAVSAVSGYENPGACSGDCWSHDPAIIRRSSDSVYFRFETGGGIGMWKAPHLTGPWKHQGVVLEGGSKIDMAGNKELWAPNVVQVGDTYILYYSVSTFGTQESAIGYATSPTLDAGSWVDGGHTGIRSTNGSPYNAIDPSLIQVGSTNYLNFGSFWDDIYQVRLNEDATTAGGLYSQIALNRTGAHAIEGSYMHYHGGYYYLFFSSGMCCRYDAGKPAPGEEYRIHVCRSISPEGPFWDKSGRSCRDSGGTDVLTSHNFVYGPGGQGVFNDPEHGTVLYYHYANTDIGLADSQYQFGWNVVDWRSGWPTV